MKLGGRFSAAIEVLEAIFDKHNSAAAALHDWGRSHRFAGSGDRSAIGNLVYDALRQKNSVAFKMGDDTPRSLVLGVARFIWGLEVAEIQEATDDKFGPDSLTDAEVEIFNAAHDGKVPRWVAGDYPQWLDPSLKWAYGDDVIEQGAALACRAPVDLRVNTLKATREQVLEALEKQGAKEGPFVETSVRINAPENAGRTPNVEVETAHGKGWYEVQDTASQIVAGLAAPTPNDVVMDLCAGAGGKTLALAAAMNNNGKIYAHDRDKRRLRPIFERVARAGATNVEVIGAEEKGRLFELKDQMDLVLLDAPCTGVGAWRRKPDSKWRLSPATLEQRIKDQKAVLESGANLTKPGGRLVYITCSLLPEENNDQVAFFLKHHKNFKLIPYTTMWKTAFNTQAPKSADGNEETLTMSPYSHDTDGFFIAIMEKSYAKPSVTED